MPERPRRADAARNRDKIRLAAAELLAAGDRRPTIQEIATRAGVAPATVHRSYPNRHQLFAAAHAHLMCDELAPTVRDLAEEAEGSDPVDGLRRLSQEQVRVAAERIEYLAELPGWVDPFIDEFVARFETDVLRVMLRAQGTGALRPDLEKEDIAGVTRLFLGGLAHPGQPIERAHRYIDLWFDAVAPRR